MTQTHDQQMSGKTVLITGATSGIGKATALSLAAMGAHLTITGRDPGRTETTAQEIRVAGGAVQVFVADLSAQADVRRLAVSTSFGAEDPGLLQRVLVPLLRPYMEKPAQGAATSVHLASAPQLAQTTGRYFASLQPQMSSKRSYDQAVAARLWQVSTNLVALAAAPGAP
jgi:hypothetical protein